MPRIGFESRNISVYNKFEKAFGVEARNVQWQQLTALGMEINYRKYSNCDCLGDL